MNSKNVNIIKFALGLTLLILNTGIWIYCFFINRPYALSTITAIPVLYAGAFLLSSWFKTSRSYKPSKPERSKFIMRVLVINYAILYLIYVIQDIIYSDSIDLLSMPGIMLPLLMGIFITGLILSWNNGLYAGIFFLLWFGLIIFCSFMYGEILHRGPYALFGLVILVHGILYITSHFKSKPGIN